LPSAYGLTYEEIAFPSRYGLSLRGWWIPATPAGDRAVILLHPLGGNRQGLAGSPGFFRPWQPVVDLLKLAQAFHAAGYAVLLFDLRSHGESERGLGAGGLTEDQDVVGAVDYAFQRLGSDDAGAGPAVGLVGFGCGAAALLAAVGREKGSAEVVYFFSGDSEGGSGFIEYRPPNVKRLSFLVAVEPASLAACLRRSWRRLGPLSPLLLLLVSEWCWRRGGYPLRSTYLPAFVREIQMPLLYVGAGPGPAAGEVQRLYEATPPPRQICWLDAAGAEVYDGLAASPDPILSFAAYATNRREGSRSGSAGEGIPGPLPAVQQLGETTPHSP
jgi:pimeloyl-ACP methyl ester carboxylesterase